VSVAAGVVWTEERSDEGRRRIRGREATRDAVSVAAGVVWTEERSDEGRRRIRGREATRDAVSLRSSALEVPGSSHETNPGT
jgi:hypothetical protein